MLQRLDEHIADALKRAEEAKKRAASASDPALRADNEMMARSWRTVARSFEFAESLVMSVDYMPASMTTVVIVGINLPQHRKIAVDVLNRFLLVQIQITIEPGVNIDAMLVDVQQWQALDPVEIIIWNTRTIDRALWSVTIGQQSVTASVY